MRVYATHNLNINRNNTGCYDYKLIMNKKGEVPLFYMNNVDFGCGPQVYSDAFSKLQYLACLSFQCYNQNAAACKFMTYGAAGRIDKPKDILKIPDIQKLEKVCQKNIVGFKRFVIIPEVFVKSNNGLLFNLDYRNLDHYFYRNFMNLPHFLQMNKITLENFLFNPFVQIEIYPS